MTSGSLLKVESIAECSPWSILHYFRPALSDNWFWKPICVFLRVAILRRFYCIFKCTPEYFHHGFKQYELLSDSAWKLQMAHMLFLAHLKGELLWSVFACVQRP